MTSTQVPIIAWENRYVTPIECMRLQSMDEGEGLKLLPESDLRAYEALGNAINVKVAMLVAKALVGQATPPQADSQNATELQVSTLASSSPPEGL
jgi:DNA (cytosine-5)-methyltransferase 1